jgi:hypothetical protein
VAGLLVALAFNTVGVWMQVGQTAQARDDTALALLAQLNGLAREAESEVFEARSGLCREGVIRPRDHPAVMKAAQHYDYLAWLFNDGHIHMESARRYWTPSMLETYEFAALLQVDIARKRFANLHRFMLSTPEEQRPGSARAYC